MENTGKNIDDLFKDELGGYTEAPPPAVWDRLEKKLVTKPDGNPGSAYRWLWYFGMVSLLLLLGASVARNIGSNKSFTSADVASANSVLSNKNKTTINTTTNNQTDLKEKDHAINSNELNGVSKTNTNPPDNNNSYKDNDPHTNKRSFTTNTTNENKTKHSKTRFAGNNKPNRYASSKTHNKTGKRKSVKTNDEEDNDDNNMYNSSGSKTNNKKEIVAENTKEDVAAKVKAKELASVPPKNVSKLSINRDEQPVPPQKSKPYFPRFEAGVKAGYETGFNNDASKKAVVSPYIQYNISPRLSVMLQPAVKSAYLDSRVIGKPQSYYKVNNDGKISGPDSGVIRVTDGTSFIDSLWQRTYTYSQSHDSIVKISSIGGNYLEFEIPVLLKYKLTPSFSVYGGVNIIYSKLISVSENTTTSTVTPITKTKKTYSGYFDPAPTPPPIDSVITYSGTPISNYSGPQFPAMQSSLLRAGYMIGFTYEYHRRWLFDALVQQGSVNKNVLGGYNINSALSSAYLRLSLGYKLTK